MEQKNVKKKSNPKDASLLQFYLNKWSLQNHWKTILKVKSNQKSKHTRKWKSNILANIMETIKCTANKWSDWSKCKSNDCHTIGYKYKTRTVHPKFCDVLINTVQTIGCWPDCSNAKKCNIFTKYIKQYIDYIFRYLSTVQTFIQNEHNFNSITKNFQQWTSNVNSNKTWKSSKENFKKV